MNRLLEILAAVAICGAPLMTMELLARRFRLNGELPRKIVHMASVLAVCLALLVVDLADLAYIAGGFFIFMWALRGGRHWRSLYGVDRHSLGELTLPLGIAILAVFAASARFFVMSALIIGFADTAAAMVGQKYGRRKLPGLPGKSFAGTAAFLAVALIITLTFSAFGTVPVASAILASVLAAFAEAVSSRGLDNVTIPLGLLLAQVFK